VERTVTRRFASEQGTSLLEVLVATLILLTLMAGLMSMSGVAISTTENQGHLAARATEYAQDKMEQLMALAYADIVSDTRSFPAASSGGTGLKVGGSYDVDNPVALYVDYLDVNGNLCGTTGADCAAPSGTTAPDKWFYKRLWKIDDSTTDGTLPANMKRITVAGATARGFGGSTRATSYLTVLKTNPF
jgi:type II secretory pathway pseudopilin PulG